jgi:hypothetical protein
VNTLGWESNLRVLLKRKVRVIEIDKKYEEARYRDK